MQEFERALKARLARATLGVTPAGVSKIYYNWLAHLAMSPAKRYELFEEALKDAYKIVTGEVLNETNGDPRFKHEGWKLWPFNLWAGSFLLAEDWWDKATKNVDGLDPADARVMGFLLRQQLDMFSPSNLPWMNPEVRLTTFEHGGRNLMQGAKNLAEDINLRISGTRHPALNAYRPGETVAATPGKVIYRNHLIELMQYEPTTAATRPEPVLIVPAWIMKYYILDLSPHNSMIKFLVDQGHTVFAISWRNPDAEDAELGMDDYLDLGVMSAMDAVSAIVGDQKIHAAGYCLGGTLLAIAAAAMARDGDDRLASMTMLAAQVDFTEAGELTMFTRESEVSYLENMMREQGYLDGRQMAGAFQVLRANDLIWSRAMKEYVLGERTSSNDLMAWNADLTRMPYRMHSEYLRRLFLNNDLSAGRYVVGDRPVNLADLRMPIFAVGTEKDHVAPWRSVYKITNTPVTDVTFLLTNGGHNAGIVSEPGHAHRHFRMAVSEACANEIDPDTWLQTAPQFEGSWWPAWHEWLVAHSGEPVKPPRMGAAKKGYAPLCDAPGEYVHQA